MRRTILISSLIIGAAIAVLVGAGTFAQFTDTEHITGSATAGIVDFELSGQGHDTGTNEAANNEDLQITFDTVQEACNFDFFAPGDSCTIPVQLTRDSVLSQLAVDLTIPNVTLLGNSDTDGSVSADCGSDSNAWTLTAALRDAGSPNENRMPAGVADNDQYVDVTLALASTASSASCQGAIINGNASPPQIDITITATQAANAHDTTYD